MKNALCLEFYCPIALKKLDGVLDRFETVKLQFPFMSAEFVMTGCQLIGGVRLVAVCKDPVNGSLGWTNGAKGV